MKRSTVGNRHPLGFYPSPRPSLHAWRLYLAIKIAAARSHKLPFPDRRQQSLLVRSGPFARAGQARPFLAIGTEHDGGRQHVHPERFRQCPAPPVPRTQSTPLVPASTTVNLSHGAIAAPDRPAMSMDFGTAPAAYLSAVKPGDTVAFTVTKTPDGGYLIDMLKSEK